MKYYVTLVLLLIQMKCLALARPDTSRLVVESSNPTLLKAFWWAKAKAISYVQTGKKGPIDISEIQSRNDSSKILQYIPSYWAGYPLRTAFYSRDFCHQVSGAHLLGLDIENLTMLKAFANSATKETKWFPVWAINFDGSIYKLDFKSTTDFVREVPAVFELVEKGYQLYCWTCDSRYIRDNNLWNYYSRAVNDFIQYHDFKKPNGVAEGAGKGIFQGTATYNEEQGRPLIEAGDGIASQYKAYWAYANMAKLRGDVKIAAVFFRKAAELKQYFNHDWGVKNTNSYNRGYDLSLRPVSGWGKENSWFMPMKEITEAENDRNLRYLDFIDAQLEMKENIPANIEAISYIPELFFKYHQNERGWKWMTYIISHLGQEHAAAELTGKNGNYPEVSYVLLSNIIEGLLGVSPDAPHHSLMTISNLPAEITDLKVSNIQLGNSIVEIAHDSTRASYINYQSGKTTLSWKACFKGQYKYLIINGQKKKCMIMKDHGTICSYVVVKLKPGQKITVTT